MLIKKYPGLDIKNITRVSINLIFQSFLLQLSDYRLVMVVVVVVGIRPTVCIWDLGLWGGMPSVEIFLTLCYGSIVFGQNFRCRVFTCYTCFEVPLVQKSGFWKLVCMYVCIYVRVCVTAR